MMTKQPRYVHDCDVCEFRGSYGPFDVYVCRKGSDCYGHDSLIARRSSDSEDYASLPRTVFARVVAEHINHKCGGFPVDASEHVLPDWMVAVLNVIFGKRGEEK